tara:strand:+ start:1574 stop:1810 length:237 start_codon:yes stop_codon:yes gene_type:complete
MIRATLIDALLAKYKGEMLEAQANIEVYLSNPVGIGEHPDIIAALDEQITLYTDANEKWNVVNDEFDKDPIQEDWDAR